MELLEARLTPSIAIMPTSLPNWTVNVAGYDQVINASGGNGPYTFALTSGTLPPGLTLSADGVLSGTPTSPGTYNFTVTATDTTFSYTTLDDPSATPGPDGTEAYGISGSNIVGEYANGSGTHGFLYDGSTYITLDDPNASPGGTTWATGICGSNIVGWYLNDTGYHGFLYDGTTYTTLDDPSAAEHTGVSGISGSNIVGSYQDSAGVQHGFLYNGSTYTTLDDPSATLDPYGGTVVTGISGSNIVGYYSDDTGGHSFLYNGSTYTTLDVPSAARTLAQGISGSDIVGYYTNTTGNHGFLYNGSTYTTLDDPNITPGNYLGTFGEGISGSNIVGWYQNSTGIHGFLATEATGGQSYTVTINPPLAITTTTLPNGTVNVGGYSQSIGVTGGTSPVTFALTSGSLPDGLTLSTAGVLSGTPTTPGSYTFTITASDSVGSNVSEGYTLIVSGAFVQYLVTPRIPGTTVTAGSSFLVLVQAADRYGNPVASYSGPSAVSLSLGPPSSASSFPATVSLDSSGLGYALANIQQVGSYTITAANGSYTGSTTTPVTVIAGPPIKLAFAVQPAGTPIGVAFPPVMVQLEDQYGNPVTTDNTDAVTVGIASGPGPFNAESTTTAVFHNGVATFNNLTLTVPGTYTLSELVPATYTGPNSTSFTITPLQVLPGSFVGSPSGFSLEFNAPYLIDSLTPVLYGHGFGAAAPAPSVILTTDPENLSDTASYVEGSLVLNPANNSITFLATNTAQESSNGSPVLPDGTYTVILRSSVATDGFQALNPGGGFLDGLGTGTPGSGNFTASFTVHTAGQDAVWIPDTADGPGQPLSAPGMNQAGAGYPVYIDDTTGNVTSVQVTLNYNPNLLTVTGVTGTGFSLLGTSAPGQAILQYSGPALPAGSQTPIGYLLASVPAGTPANPTPYKAKDLLHLTNVLLNGGTIPVTTSDALHLVAYVGDANGDGTYSSDDAIKITRAALQLDSGFAAYPLVDPVIVADTDGVGYVPPDASLQVNEAGVNVATTNLPSPPIPAGTVFQTIGNNVDPSLSLELRAKLRRNRDRGC